LRDADAATSEWMSKRRRIDAVTASSLASSSAVKIGDSAETVVVRSTFDRVHDDFAVTGQLDSSSIPSAPRDNRVRTQQTVFSGASAAPRMRKDADGKL